MLFIYLCDVMYLGWLSYRETIDSQSLICPLLTLSAFEVPTNFVFKYFYNQYVLLNSIIVTFADLIFRDCLIAIKF